jgi:hypothetical protein
MFGVIEDMVKTTANIVEDSIDIGVSVVTLGEYGDINKENVSRLIASGIIIYALSEATGIAVELLESALED